MYRLSGFMTARFLLHIRKWEAKRSAFHTSTKEDQETHTTTELDFDHSQNHSRSGVSGLESQEEAEPPRQSLFLDDFGEDPVRRARAQTVTSVVYEVGANAIVEEPRV
ncbi:hypothetical protein H0H87_003273 [Tephrocybe sp. NHM501043]|nr:hypothetical protein H0H87_003273 [Tephrocybe sp. NHM501043]